MMVLPSETTSLMVSDAYGIWLHGDTSECEFVCVCRRARLLCCCCVCVRVSVRIRAKFRPNSATSSASDSQNAGLMRGLK